MIEQQVLGERACCFIYVGGSGIDAMEVGSMR